MPLCRQLTALKEIVFEKCSEFTVICPKALLLSQHLVKMIANHPFLRQDRNSQCAWRGKIQT